MLVERIDFMGHAKDQPYKGPLAGTGGLHLLFPSNETAVRRALATTQSALTGMGIDPDGLNLAELVLAEVLNNVVEHAYAQTPGLIELEAWEDSTLLRFKVCDEGLPMPGGKPPERKEHDLDVELQDLPEGGFGWAIIRDLTSDLDYSNDGSRNTLSFALDLGELAASS